jgi:hypothetical protein
VLLKIYYTFKPLIPRRLQILLRRKVVLQKLIRMKDIWPINNETGDPPQGWTGWPGQKKFAFILTHDVETAIGQKKCVQLMNLEMELGFRSSFNFVPVRYRVSEALRHLLKKNGFEIGVHGLNHDGKLYRSREIFLSRAVRINYFLKEWRSAGFRSPAMHHNLDWIHDLNVQYDASTFDTDPFEPQVDGVGTIFPFWVSNNSNAGFIELPYTLPQDFTLFVLMKEPTINIWQKKLDWIAAKGGMALLITHPDYMCFANNNEGVDTYPVRRYKEFLNYVKTRYQGLYWHVLPEEIADFTQKHMTNQSKLPFVASGIL